MAALLSTRALAGVQAFVGAQKPRRGPAPLLARRDSYMVEVSRQWALQRGLAGPDGPASSSTHARQRGVPNGALQTR